MGQDVVTSTAVLYQLWFGARLFLKNFSVISSSYFFSSLPLVRRFSISPPAAMPYVIRHLGDDTTILNMFKNRKILLISLYVIVTVLTILGCFDLLILLAASASSHDVPIETFGLYLTIFVVILFLNILAINRLKKLKKRTDTY